MVDAVQISSLHALSLPCREDLHCCCRPRQTDKPEWAASPRWTETTDGFVPTHPSSLLISWYRGRNWAHSTVCNYKTKEEWRCEEGAENIPNISAWKWWLWGLNFRVWNKLIKTMKCNDQTKSNPFEQLYFAKKGNESSPNPGIKGIIATFFQ